MVKTRTTYGIYLPSDTEKWFNIHFSREDRAIWFAEINDLDSNDYEVRSTNVTPTVEDISIEERNAA